jgi:hypothetical protein
MKHLISPLILLSLCGTGFAEDKPILLRETLGVDADRTLGCKRGVAPTFTSGNNVTRLEAAMNSTTNRYSIFIPGGDWELPETLTMPGLWGPSLFGAGGLTSMSLGDTHYDPFGGARHGSPQTSRLIWKGDDGGTMVETKGAGFTLSGLNFQGCRIAGAGPEPTGGVYPDRAKVGLHIRPSNDSIGDRVGAKCHLSHLGFGQVETGILVGANLEDVGEPSYSGDTANHGDTIYAEDVHFGHPTSGIHAGKGSCVHIRNNQSVNNEIGAIHSFGSPEQILYLERGGKTHVGMISSSGDTTAIRVGILDVNAGGLSIDYVSLDGGSNAKLLKSDFHEGAINNAASVQINAAHIPESVSAIPQVDVGPGVWIIRNAKYLRAGSIKMRGDESNDAFYTDRPCLVYLDGCTTFGCTMEELIDPVSTGPYILKWTNCSTLWTGTAPNIIRGVPFIDGTITAGITPQNGNP